MHHSRHDDAGAHRLGYFFSQRWIPITPITLFWKEMLFIRKMNCAEVRQFYFQNGKVGCAFPKSFMGGLLEKTNQIWSAFRFSRRDRCWCGWKCNAQVENAIVAFQSQTSPCHGGDKHWKLDSIRGSWYQRFSQSISSTEGCSSGVAFDIQDNRLPSKSYSNGRFCPRWSVGSGVLECMLLLT